MLAARELAFDSKVLSFGGSADRFASSVSTKAGFAAAGGGLAERSTIVSSTGFSSTGVARAKAPPKVARDNATTRWKRSEARIAHRTFDFSRSLCMQFRSLSCEGSGTSHQDERFTKGKNGAVEVIPAASKSAKGYRTSLHLTNHDARVIGRGAPDALLVRA